MCLITPTGFFSIVCKPGDMKAGTPLLLELCLPKDFNKSRQQELCGAMSKETQRSPDRLDWDIRAADALQLARLMPPRPERN